MPHSDVLIIGSGIAALAAADQLCETMSVRILTKGSFFDGNSYLAQGGVAAVLSTEDTWDSHCKDTMEAGAFQNDPKAVKQLVENGTDAIMTLISNGMAFDHNASGSLALGREGAHSYNRIAHAGGDATGKALLQFLLKKLQDKVAFAQHTMAIDLLMHENRCTGAAARNKAGETVSYTASHTIIAAGGCGALYEHTSNHPFLTGDGLALAYRAGAELGDLEFVQFHPTMLLKNGSAAGLISEAVRGEGAFLQNELGERFMQHVHPLADLAPRDIVAREIFRQNKNGQKVFLNTLPVKNFEQRFPTITALCRKHGINPVESLIPVVPGMHFFMGGIMTDLHGRTSVENLYAAGESACTGVHGANRLASNSLLEGLVFGKKLGEYIQSKPAAFSSQAPFLKQSVHQVPHFPDKKEIQAVMTAYLGIQRTEAELSRASEWFSAYQHIISDYPYYVKNCTNEQSEIANMLTIGSLITKSALARKESRGGHYRLDYPEALDSWQGKQLIHSIAGTKIKVGKTGVA
ncbi:L-aspartate oxidase [Metabacillus sp. GX 13764]|uniref:L-aspartate oxidase n=1 Tax=Metabacillus kandeliae TaxID=2900151 RepID=UPI001E413C99|nr:L-aspartate oxidase [Metabacillus kandeliae]MCD7032940.1 L-aspartate oxidase [Metabacillus kandeliae]